MPLKLLRRRLRAVTSIWLFCQVLSLSALAPRYCCAAHGHMDDESQAHAQHGAANVHAQHGTTSTHCPTAGQPADTCPMAAAGGEACPMHKSTPGTPHAHAAATAAQSTNADDCVMQATCQGPVTALASLIWIPGIVDDDRAVFAERVDLLTPAAAAPVPSFISPIDLPPPRA